MARIFTIAPEEPFLDALALGMLKDAGRDPLNLAKATVLLPTRRAVRALGEAFLRVSGGRALLLPRLLPVGDLDADELALSGDEEPETAADLPPAVPDLRRRLLLTKLVLAWSNAAGAGPMSPGQAAPLAAELARFLDEVQAEGGRLDDLDRLVPEELADHWQKVLRFLSILRVEWPAELAAIGCLDPADRRNKALEAQAQHWRRFPPAYPVIAAGITGGVAAVATLIEAVAALPNASIVLPGLAREGEDQAWDEIAADPSHPQHLMARLLRRIGIGPSEAEPWPHRIETGTPAARRRLVLEALRPAATTERWRTLPPLAPDALHGFHRIDCPAPREEALVIALLLREALETDGATAALVTPDRELARRVAAELRRWDIEIDDSAGLPLNRTPPGVFLRLVLAAAAEALAPVPLLALLKHPLAAAGLSPQSCRALARRLETELLRGPRPAPGIAGLRAALRERPREAVLERFVTRLDRALAPLIEALALRGTTLAPLIEAHVAAAEALARSDSEAGAARLWAEAAGETAAETVSALLAAAADCPLLDGADYPALFEALIAGPVVRPRYGRHPRLFIWGLVEARLQHADRIVLGGLNEGTWPAAVPHDPWLSRPMRSGIGLPPPERRIGTAAHDFAQALGARQVFLTRASRVEGAPTVPSRWLLRLEAVLKAAGRLDEWQGAAAPLAWQAELDAAARERQRAPAFAPPVAARPRQLRVTEIETWMRDPYAIFARRVLRLKALDALDASPSAADRGTFIHKALDGFLNLYPGALPPDAGERLIDFGRDAFGAALERPGVRAFWWPRFVRIAEWFVAHEAGRRAQLAAIAAERPGQLLLDGPGGPFELIGRADRVDTLHDGTLAIIDFKTGSLPKEDEVTLGYAPQLALEGAIAEAGGFTDVAAAQVSELAFWKLGGRDPAGDVHIVPGPPRHHIEAALAGLRRLIAKFDDPATPYLSVPRPERVPRYSDYFHLARVKERLAEEDRE